jgi:hypothetical protein
MKKLGIILLLFILVASCNKDKSRSKKLMKGDVWLVESINIDGEAQGFTGNFATWTIEKDVDIYNQVPSALWDANGQEIEFNWQFRNKGKIFEIAPNDSTCDGTFPELELFGYYIAGEYKVEKQSRKEMTFTSTETSGYPGELVQVKIVRRDY